MQPNLCQINARLYILDSQYLVLYENQTFMIEREKERAERVGLEEEEEDRQLGDQQIYGREEDDEGRQLDDQQSDGREEVDEDEQELEGDTRREVLRKIKEKEKVQRVMRQMLRSLSGMLKHKRVPESYKRELKQRTLENTIRKQSNRGWIPQSKTTPLRIPKKLRMAKRNLMPMIG